MVFLLVKKQKLTARTLVIPYSCNPVNNSHLIIATVIHVDVTATMLQQKYCAEWKHNVPVVCTQTAAASNAVVVAIVDILLMSLFSTVMYVLSYTLSP